MPDPAKDTDRTPPTRPLLVVRPFDRVADDVLVVVSDSLQAMYRIPVEVGDPLPLPEHAFMENRGQYNAMALIKHLNEFHADGCLRTLGIVSYDIANPILTYVFGEAYMNGVAAVMSYARLRPSSRPQDISRELLLERAVKVAIHELGHTFGIPHCHRERCVMKASNSLAELDEKLNYFCDYCNIFLADALRVCLGEVSRESEDVVQG